MNNETGSGLETIQKAWQSVLEPTLDKADPFVLDLRDYAAEIKYTRGPFLADVLWRSLKRIKADETALRIPVHLRPEPHAMSLVDTEFQEIDRSPAAYLAMNIAIEVVQVFEGGYSAPLLRDPPSHQSIAVDPVKQPNVPRK